MILNLIFIFAIVCVCVVCEWEVVVAGMHYCSCQRTTSQSLFSPHL